MKRWLVERKVRSVVAAGIISSGLLAGGLSTVASSPAAAAGPTVLTMESTPENTVTQSFNPFSTTSSAEQLGATSMIYEPLIQFDLAKAGVYYPWLATSFSWSNGGRSITFVIRQGVKWSNGSALTPADVAFTYNLVKQYPDINTGGLPITSVSTSGNDVTVNFSSPQYTNLQGIGNVYIVPQATWSTVGDPGKYVDPNPVGTGPYKLGTFTPQGITLVKNPLYWQASQVKIDVLDYPAYASNTNAESALFSGQAQWEGNFITGLKQLFLSTSPYHQAWFAPLNTNTLEPNLNRWPTNQLAVRQAVSLAINRTAIGAQGESGLEPPAQNASGLVLPTFDKYMTKSLAQYKLNLTPDTGAAKAVLEKAGWKMGKDGYFSKNGKTLAFTISDPSSYTDYAADDSIVAQDLRRAGIDATFVGQSVTGWANDVASGNFDMVMHWSNQGITPYQQYEGWLDDALATKAASGDYERLHSPAMEADLKKLAAAATVPAQVAALAPIEKFVATDLPVIPTVYGAAFDEYNSASIVGWPTPSNPYESGQPAAPTNEVVVLHLSPRA
ncbi:MAG: ABC transporter substrate-binding protein [Actinomycetota bacterium]|nr:ABC transporter substrate-binding protein [Actinomycetota bacterium]